MPSRRMRFQANPFEVVIAALAAISCFEAVLDPSGISEITLSKAVPIGVAYAWYVGYGLSAVGIIAGLWRGNANEEAAGLILMVTSVLVQTIAVVYAAGLEAMPNVTVLFAVALGCAVRVLLLLTHRRVIVVSVAPE